MILTFIILVFANLWAWAFSVFPSGSLPVGTQAAVGTLVSWIWVANIAVDVPLLLSLLGISFTIELVILTAKFFFWVFSKIPIIGN